MLWGCSRLLPKLVDFADGNLDEAARTRIEAHLARCPRCTETVLELREVPGKLRRLAVPEPPPEFWMRQRQSVLQAIESRSPVRPVAASGSASGFRWTTPVALAASVAVMLLLGRWWAPEVRPPIEPTVGGASPAAIVEDAEPTASEEASQGEELFSTEDASLLSLAEQLDDESTTPMEETPI
jgi:anti-sigma factor RsiW